MNLEEIRKAVRHVKKVREARSIVTKRATDAVRLAAEARGSITAVTVQSKRVHDEIASVWSKPSTFRDGLHKVLKLERRATSYVRTARMVSSMIRLLFSITGMR